MDRTEQTLWLAALHAPRLGGRRLRELIASLDGIAGVAGAGSAELARRGLDSDTIAALRNPEAEALESGLDWLSGQGRDLVAFDDPRYPPLLARIPAPPPALFVEGDVDALWLPQIAIVGSRNPTVGGLDHARDFAGELSRLGLAVTSGLASGIDSAAHTAAIAAGGQTIAVAGTGLDRVYPASSVALARKIPAHGALVSEFPPGTPARAGNFPARNRIISGLSLGVLVIEAGLQSGSLITARLGAEQGREVFALPGSLHNPMARGCHRLIKQGARLVESTLDIMEELAPLAGQLAGELCRQPDSGAKEQEPGSKPARRAGLLGDPDYAALWEAMGHDPVAADLLAERCGLQAREISSMLLIMELEGMVALHPGGRFSRREAPPA